MQTQSKYGANICIVPIKLKTTLSQAEESEDNNQLKKSSLGSPSTVDSPLFSPRKGFSQDQEIENDQACHCFMEDGFCCQGTLCEATHEVQETVTNSSFMLSNYPELIIGCFPRRSLFSHL